MLVLGVVLGVFCDDIFNGNIWSSTVGVFYATNEVLFHFSLEDIFLFLFDVNDFVVFVVHSRLDW